MSGYWKENRYDIFDNAAKEYSEDNDYKEFVEFLRTQIKLGDLNKIKDKLRNSAALIAAAKKKFKDLSDDELEPVGELGEEIAKTLENNEYEMKKEVLMSVRMGQRLKAAVDYFTPAANRFAALPDMATFGHRILQETAECMKLCESGEAGEREYVPTPQI